MCVHLTLILLKNLCSIRNWTLLWSLLFSSVRLLNFFSCFLISDKMKLTLERTDSCARLGLKVVNILPRATITNSWGCGVATKLSGRDLASGFNTHLKPKKFFFQNLFCCPQFFAKSAKQKLTAVPPHQLRTTRRCLHFPPTKQNSKMSVFLELFFGVFFPKQDKTIILGVGVDLLMFQQMCSSFVWRENHWPSFQSHSESVIF